MNEDETFCIFGDSVTQAAYVKDSWVELLRNYLEEKYKDSFINAFNLGIGGNTSSNILKRFDFESSVRGPTQIVFAFGVNDSGYFRTLDNPIVSESKFERNVNEIIQAARKYTQDISFVGLVLGDDSLLKPFPGSSQGKSYDIKRVQVYNSILRKISVDSNCQFIELFDKLDNEDFIDGLHPNEQGHKKMFEVIKKNF